MNPWVKGMLWGAGIMCVLVWLGRRAAKGLADDVGDALDTVLTRER